MTDVYILMHFHFNRPVLLSHSDYLSGVVRGAYTCIGQARRSPVEETNGVLVQVSAPRSQDRKHGSTQRSEQHAYCAERVVNLVSVARPFNGNSEYIHWITSDSGLNIKP